MQLIMKETAFCIWLQWPLNISLWLIPGVAALQMHWEIKWYKVYIHIAEYITAGLALILNALLFLVLELGNLNYI